MTVYQDSFHMLNHQTFILMWNICTMTDEGRFVVVVCSEETHEQNMFSVSPQQQIQTHSSGPTRWPPKLWSSSWRCVQIFIWDKRLCFQCVNVVRAESLCVSQAVGMLYLHQVLKPIINRIFEERKYVELDPCKIDLNRSRCVETHTHTVVHSCSISLVETAMMGKNNCVARQQQWTLQTLAFRSVYSLRNVTEHQMSPGFIFEIYHIHHHFRSLGSVRCLNVVDSLFCSPRLHLFDQKYCENV